MKKCTVCKEIKDDSEFYKGLAQCKPCYKNKVTEYRNNNIEKIRAYDRNRGNRQPKGYNKEYRAKYPNKYKAHNMVNNCLRDGKIKKHDECSNCQSTFAVEAHHDDYAYPLEIRWLCAACHKQWHRDNGEGLNP